MSDTQWTDGKVTDAYLTKSAVKGTPSIHFEIAVGVSGRKMEHDMWITPNTTDRCKETLAGFGFKVGKDDLRNVGEHLRGKDCRVGIGEEEYKGEVREKVQFVSAVNEDLDERDAADIAAELFGLSAPARGKVKPPKTDANTPNSAGKTPEEESDDVPFILILPFVLAALGAIIS